MKWLKSLFKREKKELVIAGWSDNLKDMYEVEIIDNSLIIKTPHPFILLPKGKTQSLHFSWFPVTDKVKEFYNSEEIDE